MSTVFLGLGSNIDATVHLRAGVAALRAAFAKVSLSPVYQTPAVGFEGNPFLNLAACVETELTPLELKSFLNELEAAHGRRRNVPKFSDRTLDIDILLYDDLYLVSPQLVIPRTDILRYAHVLKPLSDLAPKLVHPVKLQTIAEIWRAFQRTQPDISTVELDLTSD